MGLSVYHERGNQYLGANSICSDRNTRAEAVGPAGYSRLTAVGPGGRAELVMFS